MAANEEKACNYKRQRQKSEGEENVKMRRRRIHDTKIVTTCQNEKFKVEEKNEQGRKKKEEEKKRDVSTLLTQITVQKKNVK